MRPLTGPTESTTLTPAAEGLGYLPGLDGLRAVSVLAVIAYHLDLTWATGGYLGVEVFFVVSGYLITLLMLDEHRRTGAVNRLQFWGRRVRRLLPAVVVLLVGVLAWSAIAAEPGELRRFRGEALAGLAYVQNWHAIVTEEPYFVSFGRPSPLRHLWSLAIEEQFYLLWPLLLPAGLRRFGRRRTAGLTLIAAGASVLVMTALADVAAPERAYYGTDSRAFGILLGAALAFGWRPDRFRPDIGAGARRTLEWGGVAALAALLWQLGRRGEFDPWTYPWGFLWVDAVTVVLIVATTHPASRLRHRLGSPLLALVGRRSYSLYLWHWPVIAFTRPEVDWGLSGAAALAVRLVLIAALSELSYRVVEQPFRDGRAQAWLWAVADRANARRLLGVTVAAGAVPVVALLVAVVTAPTPDAAVVATASPVTIELSAPTTATTTTTSPVTTTAPPSSTTTLPASAPTSPPTTAAPAPAPSPEPPPPPPRPVPDVTVVGESVTLGAAPGLQGALGERVQIDAAEGRSFEDGIEVVEMLTLAGRLTPTVIVHLGTNGAAPEGGLERIQTAIGPERHLVVTTVRVDRPWEGQVNDTIRRFAESCANCSIADWNAMASTEPGLTTDDGVHLTRDGIRRYTDLLVASI